MKSSAPASGLPVVDFGHVLRVPLCQLEKMIGGPLTTPGPEPTTAPTPKPGDSVATDVVPAAPEVPRRSSRRRVVGPDQPRLPFAS